MRETLALPVPIVQGKWPSIKKKETKMKWTSNVLLKQSISLIHDSLSSRDIKKMVSRRNTSQIEGILCSVAEPLGVN